MRSYFAGLTRDETVDNCGASGGTISGIWSELEERIGPDGKAARNLVLQLKKNSLTIGEAAQGAEVFNILRKLGANPEGVEAFSKDFYEASVRKGRRPETLADAASTLLEMEEETGLSFEKILGTARKKADELAETLTKLSNSKKELEDTNRDLESMLVEMNTTKENLDRYVKTRGDLKSWGLDVDQDLEKAVNVLGNINERGDAENVVREVESHKSLLNENRGLAESVKSMKEEKEKLEKSKERLNEQIGIDRGIVNEIDSVKKLGFTQEKLTSLKQKITEICSAAGVKPAEALDVFFKDLEEYDAQKGFEYQLVAYTSQVETIELKLKKLQAEQQALETSMRDRKQAVDSAQKMIRKGVEARHIVAWEKILEKVKVEPQTLLRELEDYAGIEGTLSVKKKHLSDLENKTTRTETKLRELETNKSELMSSITAIRDEAIQKLDEAAKQVNQYLDAASEAGRRLGSLEAIPPLTDLIMKGEGDVQEANAALLFILQRYRIWLDKKGYSPYSLRERLDDLIKAVPST